MATTSSPVSSSPLMSIKDIKAVVYPDPPRKDFHPSPSAWEDQVLYLLLPDRFSNGQESSTDMYDGSQSGNAVKTDQDAQTWRSSGVKFVGGTLRGLQSKLPYLKDLGVTALWIGPVWKNVSWVDSYHGYAVQDFLDVDPRFGTRDDLKKLVESAHSMNIYVILDIILNHSGNVFEYVFDQPDYTGTLYDVKGFYKAKDDPSLALGPVDHSLFPDSAIWPSELQSAECFSRKGRIRDGNSNPEFLDGDFFDLKDIALGAQYPDNFQATTALKILCEVFKYWIAFADIDGYRIDTVRHIGHGPTRYFASVIHEYAAKIGKDRFILMGEITRNQAYEYVQITGLDAAQGLGGLQEKLWKLPRGDVNPSEYFDLFRNALYLNQGSHTWLRDKVVTMIDDHDQVWRVEGKGRFCSVPKNELLVGSAIMFNLCTMGIPCIYYGTEQAFDGSGAGDGADRYIREAMFATSFGAFRSKGAHFFNKKHPVYQAVTEVIEIRKQELALSRGRQYLRDVSGNGSDFGPTTKLGDGPIQGIVAWSRLLAADEILCAINTDPDQDHDVWVNVDTEVHPPGSKMKFMSPASGSPLLVESKSGRAAVHLVVKAGGFAILK